MPARPERFQATAINGVFMSAKIFDEITAVHPLTDEIQGTGNLMPPVELTPDGIPALFAELNAIAGKSGDRLTAARAKLAAEIAAQ